MPELTDIEVAKRYLDGDTLKQLYQAIGEVLSRDIEAQADTARLPPDYLLANRKKGANCPKCPTPLATTKAAGRTSWYGPQHQKR